MMMSSALRGVAHHADTAKALLWARLYHKSPHHGERVVHMINAFRDHGHSIARLDPLRLGTVGPTRSPADLVLSNYSFTEEQLDAPAGFSSDDDVLLRVGRSGFSRDSGTLTVRELHQRLEEICVQHGAQSTDLFGSLTCPWCNLTQVSLEPSCCCQIRPLWLSRACIAILITCAGSTSSWRSWTRLSLGSRSGSQC